MISRSISKNLIFVFQGFLFIYSLKYTPFKSHEDVFYFIIDVTGDGFKYSNFLVFWFLIVLLTH